MITFYSSMLPYKKTLLAKAYEDKMLQAMGID